MLAGGVLWFLGRVGGRGFLAVLAIGGVDSYAVEVVVLVGRVVGVDDGVGYESNWSPGNVNGGVNTVFNPQLKPVVPIGFQQQRHAASAHAVILVRTVG